MLEVGGGNGTFARDVLLYLQREEPTLYADCRYQLLEIAEPLAAQQRATLGEALGADEAAARVTVVNEDALTWAAARPGSLTGPWWICLFEVLDNLGHDLLRVRAPRGGGGGFGAGARTTTLEQVVVECLDGASSADATAELRRARWELSYEAVTDADLAAAVQLLGLTSLDGVYALRDAVAQTDGSLAGAQLASDMRDFLGGLLGDTGSGRSEEVEVWVPTGCYRLLQALCSAAPHAQFTIADYSWLPPQPDGAVLAPVVQTQRGGQTIDLRGDPTRAVGDADILFPTHFRQLEALVAAASGGRAAHARSASTAEFMREWHVDGATRTASGFDPVVDDFANTAVLVTGGA